MKNRRLFSCFLVVFMLMVFITSPISAAKQIHRDEYAAATYNSTLSSAAAPTINFIKADGTEITAANPLASTDGNFGLKAKFELSMIDDFIEGIADGSLIPSIPAAMLTFIDTYKGLALLSGSIDFKVDLSAGAGLYTVNPATIAAILADNDLLLGGNAAYAAIFDVESVVYNSATFVMDVVVSMKSGVTGQDVLDLKDQFGTFDLVINNLFIPVSTSWDLIDNVNNGEFPMVAEIETPENIFLVGLPAGLYVLAQVVRPGLTNPMVGVEITVSSGDGTLFLKANTPVIPPNTGVGNSDLAALATVSFTALLVVCYLVVRKQEDLLENN